MAKAVKVNSQYTLTLTLSQDEAEALRCLLHSHVAMGGNSGLDRLSDINQALKEANVGSGGTARFQGNVYAFKS